MEKELSRMKRRPAHRSTQATLQKLADDDVYLSLDEERDDVLGELDLANVGMKITGLFARRFGSDRRVNGPWRPRLPNN